MGSMRALNLLCLGLALPACEPAAPAAWVCHFGDSRVCDCGQGLGVQVCSAEGGEWLSCLCWPSDGEGRDAAYPVFAMGETTS